MPPRTRTPSATDPSSDDRSNLSSPPNGATVPDKIVSPDVQARRGPTIRSLMIEVMREVLFVGKDQRNREQKFNFRGIDDVTRALGTSLRTHGVLTIPEVIDAQRRDCKTTGGKNSRETILRVRFTFTCASGDTLIVITEGESLDSGDKGTAKAMSVAWRTALIIAFSLPTDEPDPDSYSYERERDDRRDDRPRRDDRRRDDRDDRPRNRARTNPDRVSAEDGNERDDLIDTEDVDQLRDQMLLTLKDKIRYYKIDKGRAGDTFEAIFGEELQDADPDLIEKFTALIVQLGGLPDIDADPAEQHPAVAKLMSVRNVGPDDGPGAGGGDDNP
jgi:ERF superfamily